MPEDEGHCWNKPSHQCTAPIAHPDERNCAGEEDVLTSVNGGEPNGDSGDAQYPVNVVDGTSSSSSLQFCRGKLDGGMSE